MTNSLIPSRPLAIRDVTSPVKLVGKISSCARFQAASSHSDLTLVRGCISKVQESSRVQIRIPNCFQSSCPHYQAFLSEQENALEETVEACVISLRDLDLHERVFVLTFFFFSLNDTD